LTEAVCSWRRTDDGRIPHAVREAGQFGNFIAALRRADLVISSGVIEALCGSPHPENPKVLTLLVVDEADAWIINRAKNAIS
jgi:hypothetical protein